MATLNLCGWESRDSVEAAATSGTFSVQNSIARNGGYALRTNPTTTAVGYHEFRSFNTGWESSGGSVSTSYIRFYFYVATAPGSNNEPICVVQTGGSANKAELRINSSRNLLLYDTSLSLLGTGSTVLSLSTWYRIELQVSTGAGASAYELKIDGVSELSGTGSLNSGTAAWIRLGKVANRNSQTVDFYYDDFLWSDSAFPGAGQIEVMLPNANGNYQDWTIGAGSGSHWEIVDELPHNSDTDYLIEPGSGDVAETEALESTSSAGISGTITSVKPLIVARSGTASCRLRSGSTDSTGSLISVGASYARYSRLFDTDPATSAAWTTSGLDGIEVGMRDNSANGTTRMTLVCAMVDFNPSTAVSLLTLLGAGV